MQDARQSGFTLIELSIVLVIIGLIVGGVLVGQSLIAAAAVRATASQLERFNTAVNTFKIKYDCIPGNCPNPAQFGLPGFTNTTGVLSSWTVGSYRINLQDFWGQLRAAHLLQDSLPGGYPSNIYASYYAPGWVSPTCPVCQANTSPMSAVGYTIDSGGWTLWDIGKVNLDCSPLGTGYANAGGSVPKSAYVWNLSRAMSPGGGYGGVVKPSDAAMLDQKIDDGKPLTGSVIAIGDYTYSNVACSGNAGYPAIIAPLAQCVNSVSNTYVTTQAGVCSFGVPYNWGVDLLLPAAFTD